MYLFFDKQSTYTMTERGEIHIENIEDCLTVAREGREKFSKAYRKSLDRCLNLSTTVIILLIVSGSLDTLCPSTWIYRVPFFKIGILSLLVLGLISLGLEIRRINHYSYWKGKCKVYEKMGSILYNSSTEFTKIPEKTILATYCKMYNNSPSVL